jgi:hypothetical protein
MAKAPVVKKVKMKPFQKLLTVMISGKPVTKEEIDTLLGHEIFMYRISTYMWHIKTNASGVIKVVKDGRKVAGYQLVNVAEVKEYMKRVGILNAYTPSVKLVASLQELEATELPKVEEPATMTVTKIEAPAV